MKRHQEMQKTILSGINKCTLYLLLLLMACSCRKNNKEEYVIMDGPFRQTITETGELEAVNASYILMPRINYRYGYDFKLIGLVEHGKNVHKGDSIIKIDPSSIYKRIIEREESLESEQAVANRQKVQMENNLQELKAQLQNELAAYNLKKLEVERYQFESANKRKIVEYEFQQSEIRLNKIKRNLKLRPRLDSLDFEIQKIRLTQSEAELKSAREVLKQMLILSPIDGIFQVNVNMQTGQTTRVGDEVYTGSMIASIPDITNMKVRTFVNETDIMKVFPGMKVIVRLDALPSVPFHGEIFEISKICTERDNEKVFKIQIKISESDLRLKPGMTVSCEYICHESRQRPVYTK